MRRHRVSEGSTARSAFGIHNKLTERVTTRLRRGLPWHVARGCPFWRREQSAVAVRGGRARPPMKRGCALLYEDVTVLLEQE